MTTTGAREPIAIIGIGCRFPGASGPAAFWELLTDGRDAVREVPADRWDAAAFYDADQSAPGKIVSRKAGLIDDIEDFDWRTFRIPPREAKYMDPQQRLLLEVAWEAFEDAGIPFEQAAGSRTGVYIAMMWKDYLSLQTRDPAMLTGYSATGSGFAFGPNRISFTFDLHGPSVAVDGACAGSLVSVHTACQSLWLGESDLALAGGVNLMLAPYASIMLSKAGVLSPEGQSRTLDAKADGFVRGEGAGIVVLKPYSQVTPADRVYAVIRGSAVSHNGHNEWISAASAAGQERTLAAAYAASGIDPATVDYVELNGTGLPKGDPIEAGVVGRLIGTCPGRERPCALGSVKSNIGHLDSAAGIAGLIKTALALHHRQIPATLHLDEVNPAIPLDSLGLSAQDKLGEWPAVDRPGVAGVSAISMSGLNAHVVLEATPPEVARPAAMEALPANQLLPLSAPSQTALEDLVRDVVAYLEANPDVLLSDVCFTAAMRRTHHAHRVAVPFSTRDELLETLRIMAADGPGAGREGPSEPESLAGRYAAEGAIEWRELFPDGGRCVAFPTTPWQRERMWLEGVGPLGAHAELASDSPPAAATTFDEGLRRLPAAERRTHLYRRVRELVAHVIGIETPTSIPPGQGFFELGMTSLSATELVALLRHDIGRSLPETLALEYPTIQALTDYLAETVLTLDPASSRNGDPHAAFQRDQTLANRVHDLTDEEAEALLLERLREIRGD